MWVPLIILKRIELIVCSFVGLGEDPQVLAIRAPELFGVSINSLLVARIQRLLI